MVIPAIKKRILGDLARLSPADQARVAEWVHHMAVPSPKGVPVAELAALAGSLDDDSAREMLDAIEDGCERIDLDGW